MALHICWCIELCFPALWLSINISGQMQRSSHDHITLLLNLHINKSELVLIYQSSASSSGCIGLIPLRQRPVITEKSDRQQTIASGWKCHAMVNYVSFPDHQSNIWFHLGVLLCASQDLITINNISLGRKVVY